MVQFKLGKRPARKSAMRLYLSRYLNRSIVKVDSAPRRNFGAIVLANPMAQAAWTDPLGNDNYGDCFWAGTMREAWMRMASAGTPITYSPADAANATVAAYEAYMGHPVSQGDEGTDALAGMNFWQQHGVAMPDGSVHKIGSYVWVNPQDADEIVTAFNLFDGMGFGLEFPASWEFLDVWDETMESPEGGHWVAGVNDVLVTPDGIEIDSWGTKRILTFAAIATKADEIGVMIAPDMFGPNGKSIAGFDAEQLQADEKALAVNP